MGCSGCGKRNARKAAKSKIDIMTEYKYLNDRQLKARLEVYKKQHCQGCNKKEKCDYERYVSCKKNKGIK